MKLWVMQGKDRNPGLSSRKHLCSIFSLSIRKGKRKTKGENKHYNYNFDSALTLGFLPTLLMGIEKSLKTSATNKHNTCQYVRRREAPARLTQDFNMEDEPVSLVAKG